MKVRRNYTLALDHYRQTLVIAQELEDQGSTIELLKAMGSISAEIGDFEGAMVYLQFARQQYEELGLHDQILALDQIIEMLRNDQRQV